MKKGDKVKIRLNGKIKVAVISDTVPSIWGGSKRQSLSGLRK